jgi:integration host factor subunit alpha
MSLGKKDIVKNIHSETLLNRYDSKIFLDRFIEIIKHNSINNKIVKISKFGSFYSRMTPDRIGRNPKTKEEYIITKRKKLFFRYSSNLKDRLN